MAYLRQYMNQYQIKVRKYENIRIINEKDINENPFPKRFIELMIKDILSSNPNIGRFKDTFIILDKKEKIVINQSLSFDYYSGFKFELVDTDRGVYMNLALAHKFIRTENILEFMKKSGNLRNRTIQEEIRAHLIDRSFKVSYINKRNYKINDILFDRSPINQTFNYHRKVLTLMKYYEQEYNIKIKDKDQPLILARIENNRGESFNLYFIPELCHLIGIDDENLTDINFMKKLSEYTRLEPNQRVNELNKFIELLEDDTRKEKTNWSSKEKAEYYGVQIKPIKELLFSAYYMNPVRLKDGKGNSISIEKNQDLVKIMPMINWLFFYNAENYYDADFLNKSLRKASEKYHIKMNEPEWVEMKNNSISSDWIENADVYLKEGK